MDISLNITLLLFICIPNPIFRIYLYLTDHPLSFPCGSLSRWTEERGNLRLFRLSLLFRFLSKHSRFLKISSSQDKRRWTISMASCQLITSNQFLCCISFVFWLRFFMTVLIFYVYCYFSVHIISNRYSYVLSHYNWKSLSKPYIVF